MNKCMRTLFVGSIFALVFIALMTLSPNNVKAADAGEYVHFRIDSELNALIADKGTLTLRWYCTGATTFGEVNDATASESTNLADGIIKVASSSQEMINSSCTIGASETLRASASIDGWVVRTWTASSFPGASTSDPFSTGASLDYNFVVGPVRDELSNSLTLNGTTASASYSGTTASSSYSGGYKYIAATANGTLTGGGDGYVNKTVAVTWSSDYTTASKSADFSSAVTSTYNGDQLPLAVKINLDKTDRTGLVYSNIAGATVSAGDSYGISCTDNNDGDYYCVVPVAHAGVLARADAIPVGGQDSDTTCTYTDRTSGSDAQSTCTISAKETPIASGGGGNYDYFSAIAATPTPTPTPTSTPVPTPSLTPTPTPVPTALYRKADDPKVYVQGGDGTLTWVKTLEEFNAAGYNWSNVKVISGAEFAKMKISTGSVLSAAILYRKADDPKVYVQGGDGTLTWVKTLEEFNAAGYNWSNVKVITGAEFGQMRVGGDIRVVKGIGYLRVRSGPSTGDDIAGQVLPDQELKFTEIKNGWYHINSGWVSGQYVTEF